MIYLQGSKNVEVGLSKLFHSWPFIFTAFGLIDNSMSSLFLAFPQQHKTTAETRQFLWPILLLYGDALNSTLLGNLFYRYLSQKGAFSWNILERENNEFESENEFSRQSNQ